MIQMLVTMAMVMNMESEHRKHLLRPNCISTLTRKSSEEHESRHFVTDTYQHQSGKIT